MGRKTTENPNCKMSIRTMDIDIDANRYSKYDKVIEYHLIVNMPQYANGSLIYVNKDNFGSNEECEKYLMSTLKDLSNTNYFSYQKCLCYLIRNNISDLFIKALEFDPNSNTTPEENLNLYLCYALWKESKEVFEYLLGMITDISYHKNEAIKMAICRTNIPAFNIFSDQIDINVDDGVLLCVASKNSRCEMMKLLLERGADPLARDSWAFKYILMEELRGAMDRPMRDSVISLMIKLGCDVNCSNGYIINEWVRSAHAYRTMEEGIEYFCKKGGDVSKLDPQILKNAIKKLSISEIKILIENGADTSELFSDGGLYPEEESKVQYLMGLGHEECDVLRLLLQKS